MNIFPFKQLFIIENTLSRCGITLSPQFSRMETHFPASFGTQHTIA